MQHPYQTGDPVMDAAQGRPMIVLEPLAETVDEWSDRNGYNLLDNYANAKFDPSPDEPVARCVYVSDVRSEPSKDYTFPISRLRLIDAHHADDRRRVADRVRRDTLEGVFLALADAEMDHRIDGLADTLRPAFGDDLVSEARELADVEQTVKAND